MKEINFNSIVLAMVFLACLTGLFSNRIGDTFTGIWQQVSILAQKQWMQVMDLQLPAITFVASSEASAQDSGFSDSAIELEQRNYIIVKEQESALKSGSTEKEEDKEGDGNPHDKKEDKSRESGQTAQVSSDSVESAMKEALEKSPFVLRQQLFDPKKTSQYSWNQLTSYDFLVENLYQVHNSTMITSSQLDGEKLLSKDLSIDTQKDGPQILIYHTHASEYFADSDENDPSTLITGVGDYLTKLLAEEYGYKVIHDTTLFRFNTAYSQGRQRVTELLEKYPSIQVVLDVHRDAAAGRHYVETINNKPTATILFFNGMSQTTSGAISGRENPNREDNLAFSLQMKVAADELFPGFARKNYLRAYRYNMDLAGRYALIEVGAETNTVEEVMNAMEPLAAVIHQVLQ